jgi:hypothetical protein
MPKVTDKCGAFAERIEKAIPAKTKTGIVKQLAAYWAGVVAGEVMPYDRFQQTLFGKVMPKSKEAPKPRPADAAGLAGRAARKDFQRLVRRLARTLLGAEGKVPRKVVVEGLRLHLSPPVMVEVTYPEHWPAYVEAPRVGNRKRVMVSGAAFLVGEFVLDKQRCRTVEGWADPGYRTARRLPDEPDLADDEASEGG